MNQIPTESVRLLRDVDAYMVPSGDEVKLLAGNLVKITQTLGGNYTVIMNGNMVQIREENVDALGIKIEKKAIESDQNGDVCPDTPLSTFRTHLFNPSIKKKQKTK